MPIGYDHQLVTLALLSDDCPDCEQPLHNTGCVAPGCDGLACQGCGAGCDYGVVSAQAGGQCATALAAESTADRRERINEERAAFGLSPIAN